MEALHQHGGVRSEHGHLHPLGPSSSSGCGTFFTPRSRRSWLEPPLQVCAALRFASDAGRPRRLRNRFAGVEMWCALIPNVVGEAAPLGGRRTIVPHPPACLLTAPCARVQASSWSRPPDGRGRGRVHGAGRLFADSASPCWGASRCQRARRASSSRGSRRAASTMTSN